MKRLENKQTKSFFMVKKPFLFKIHSGNKRERDDENERWMLAMGKYKIERRFWSRNYFDFSLPSARPAASLKLPISNFYFQLWWVIREGLSRNTQTINFTFVIIISRRMKLDGKKFECLQWTMWIFCMRRQFMIMKPWQWAEGKKGGTMRKVLC